MESGWYRPYYQYRALYRKFRLVDIGLLDCPWNKLEERNEENKVLRDFGYGGTSRFVF